MQFCRLFFALLMRLRGLRNRRFCTRVLQLAALWEPAANRCWVERPIADLLPNERLQTEQSAKKKSRLCLLTSLRSHLARAFNYRVLNANHATSDSLASCRETETRIERWNKAQEQRQKWTERAQLASFFIRAPFKFEFRLRLPLRNSSFDWPFDESLTFALRAFNTECDVETCFAVAQATSEQSSIRASCIGCFATTSRSLQRLRACSGQFEFYRRSTNKRALRAATAVSAYAAFGGGGCKSDCAFIVCRRALFRASLQRASQSSESRANRASKARSALRQMRR